MTRSLTAAVVGIERAPHFPGWIVRCSECGPVHSTYEQGYAEAAANRHQLEHQLETAR